MALGGATPGCPRVGIRYSRCPSPTSTWGAATSRHAAVAIILTPSPCRRRIAPATSRTPLCRPPSPPLSLSLTPAVKKKPEKRKREPFHSNKAYKPPLPLQPSTQPPPTTSTIITYHHQLPRATLASDTSQGKREQGFY